MERSAWPGTILKENLRKEGLYFHKSDENVLLQTPLGPFVLLLICRRQKQQLIFQRLGRVRL